MVEIAHGEQGGNAEGDGFVDGDLGGLVSDGGLECPGEFGELAPVNETECFDDSQWAYLVGPLAGDGFFKAGKMCVTLWVEYG